MKTYAVFLFLSGIAISAYGQSRSDSVAVPINEVIVSENRLQVPFARQNRNVQIIDRRLIESLPARSVNELLSHVAGVDLRQRGPFGTQADVSIDGGSFEQVLVLLNGVKVLDAQTGHNTLNLPVPTDAIERIEIIRGPAARIYGINSLSGAINIVTRAPNASGITANAFSGTGFKRNVTDSDEYYNGRGVQIGGNLVNKGGVHSIYGGHDSGNGYRYNTGFTNNKVFYQGNVNTGSESSLKLMAGYVNSDFGANGFYAAPGDRESREVVQTVIASAGHDSRIGQNLIFRPRVSYRYAYDDYRYLGNLTTARSQHRGHALNTELNAALETSAGTFGFGLEMRNEFIRSSNIGDHDRDNYGLYTEFKTDQIADLSLSLGAYVNYNTDFGWQVFPGIDLGYSLTERFKIVAHTGTGQRIPSFTDLYLNQRPGNIGNPALASETAWHAEAGFKYIDGRWMAHAGYFYRSVDNFIDWVRTSTAQPWQPANFTRNRVNGITASSSYRVIDGPLGLMAGISYNYLSPSYDDSRAAGFLSKYVIESLRHQLAANITITAGKLTANVAGRYNERISYKSYFVGDARIAYQFRHFNLYADAQNLFDVTYIEAAAVPMPGRWLTLGTRLRL